MGKDCRLACFLDMVSHHKSRCVRVFGNLVDRSSQVHTINLVCHLWHPGKMFLGCPSQLRQMSISICTYSPALDQPYFDYLR
jgi:hypothetical protein